MKLYYLQYGEIFLGPYDSWSTAYFSGMEIFGFYGWKIVSEKKDVKKPSKASPWVYAAFIIGLAIIFCFAISSMTACCPKTITKIEKVIEYRDRVVHDTTTFEITKEVETIVTRDTTSHLENDYAQSDAVVSGGFLHHSLESKPQIIKVPFVVHVTDTLWRESEIKETIKEVEKPLSWWGKLRMNGFWVLLVVVIGLLLYVFRKPLLKLIANV